MSDKYEFITQRCGRKAAQRPVCTSEIARLYKSKMEGLSGSVTRMDNRAGGLRAAIFKGVRDVLGPSGLGCERYLLDAVYRWMIERVNTEGSAKRYLYAMRCWVEWSGFRSLSSQVGRTRKPTVLDYVWALREQGLSPRSVCWMRSILQGWFSWLIELDLFSGPHPVGRAARRLVTVDPARMERGDGSRQSLTAAEAQRLLTLCAGIPPVQCAALVLMVSTGIRGDELAGVEFRNLSRDAEPWSLVIHGKGGKTRKVMLEDPAMTALERYLEVRPGREDGALLRKQGGARVCTRTVQRWAKAALTRIGRPDMATHDLRRTHATLLIERGADYVDVQRRLGHSDLKLTLRCYTTRHRQMTVTTGLKGPWAPGKKTGAGTDAPTTDAGANGIDTAGAGVMGGTDDHTSPPAEAARCEGQAITGRSRASVAITGALQGENQGEPSHLSIPPKTSTSTRAR
jgi:integrase